MRLIDADALKDNLIATLAVYRRNARYDKTLVPLKRVIGIISSAPTIEPKRGEWKKVKNIHVWDISGIETWGVKRKCTNCDFRHTFIEDHGHYNFCPNCGAEMKGADDE